MDIEKPGALVSYLKATGRVGEDEELVVRVLKGGVSNRTVLVERHQTGGAWVVKQALPKLRVAVDWFSDPQRVHREALGLRWLEALAPPGTITSLLFEDRDIHLLAMEAVPEPHENWKTMLLDGRLENDHVEQFGRLLGTVHRGGYEHREEAEPVFRDRSVFESLRLEPYYGYAAERVPEASRVLRRLVDETLSRRDTLVHGDYSPKNVLVREERLILLDHEVIHFGDAAFDLGFGLTHFLSKANHLPEKRSAFAEAARLYWSVYREEIGVLPWVEGLEQRTVRHTLGCLLARVAGRSPLEYLDEEELVHQSEAVLELIHNPPESVPGLVEDFLGRL
ncbi:MAG TPA: phosphotransferase [Rubrobacter sp.]|nr:phosphotransferase [Rubrobacter sp.]